MKHLILKTTALIVAFMFIGTAFLMVDIHRNAYPISNGLLGVDVNPSIQGNSAYNEHSSVIQTKYGSPYISAYGTNASTSLNLSKSQEYFFVGSTAGGGPITNASWNSDLNVHSHYSGYLSIIIGHQNTERGNYSFYGSNYGIAGTGVSNFSSYVSYNASSSTNTSLNLSFATNSGDLVVILIGGEGDGYINTTNVQNLNVATNYTYSEGGSNVIASGAIYYGYLPSGSYTLKINSNTFPTNAGTSIGAVAYIFSPVKVASIYKVTNLYIIIGVVVAVAVIGSAIAVMRKRK